MDNYIDHLYKPKNLQEGLIEFNYKPKYGTQPKTWKEKLKSFATKAAVGAGVAGLAGYGAYTLGKNGKQAALRKFREEDACALAKGEKSLVDGFNTFSALGYNRPENLKKLSDKLFKKRDDNEPVVSGGFGNPTNNNNG